MSKTDKPDAHTCKMNENDVPNFEDKKEIYLYQYLSQVHTVYECMRICVCVHMYVIKNKNENCTFGSN